MAGLQRLGALQRAVLKMLGEADDITFAFLTSGASSRAFMKTLHRLKKERYQKAIYESVGALKRRGLVRAVERDGEHYLTLSREGAQAVQRYHFRDMVLSRSESWDGIWRIVIFDVPERHGKARRALSYKLHQIGALRLQDSVYIYPFPWKDEIDLVSEFFQVGAYMRYIEAARVEGDKELREHFDV
jgi:phenylacetic acid degradation operon negative regulatory protein